MIGYNLFAGAKKGKKCYKCGGIKKYTCCCGGN